MTAPRPEPPPLHGPFAKVVYGIERGLELIKCGRFSEGVRGIDLAGAELRELVTAINSVAGRPRRRRAGT